MDETATPDTIETVLSSVEVIDGTCYPTHHDYQQATGQEYAGLPMLYCRLCGDVRAIALPREDAP